MINVRPIIKAGLRFARTHSTKLLAGGAILSNLLGYWFMHKEAPVVRDRLNALPKDAKLIDRIKVAAPVYWPALLMLLSSGACTVGCCAVGEARVADAVAIATMSETALAKYEKEVVNVVGEEKARELHTKAAEGMLAEAPITDDYIICTTHGADIFYEPFSGRRFTSSVAYIDDAVAKFNNGFDLDFHQTVNDWYDCLDIPQVPLGGMAEYDIDHKMELTFKPMKFPDNRYGATIIYHTLPQIPIKKC